MKKIEAVIRKAKFDEVIEALHEIEVNFFCYWDVTGRGNEKIGKVYRGISYSTKDIERTLLSIVVSDSFVEKSIKAIIDSGATGEIGDGKIFLYNCEEAYIELELERRGPNHLIKCIVWNYLQQITYG